ncbi:MAG: radical SAM protein [Lachnospiraceae bacterium]|nr:radical SAM protein [Lachnospiraceae bacterium]
MSGCTMCPRRCGVNRETGTGACGCGAELKVARAALHMWEEPCISGTRGSGTVFFSGCPLHCIFCQNRAISDGKAGKVITGERLSEIFLELQEKGAANINLVTPGHYAPQAAAALGKAKTAGLTLPVICNTGGYESREALEMLAGVTDVWLPDLKYLNAETARNFSHAPDYPEIAKAAIDFMVEKTGELSFSDDGYVKKGVIVRHLVLPGHVEESKEIIQYLHDRYGGRIWVSIMNQYTPPAEKLPYPELNRKLTSYEYKKVVDFALSIGMENAYIQEGGTAKESFIPAFDCEGV